MSVSSCGGKGWGGNPEVSPLSLRRAHRDMRAAGAEANHREGGSWGKHCFSHATEPKAEEG